mmetsp:Transcript_4527/g.6825  ORF Transcript_4527/g.6825 Transcript_4527/m.6825 type:complete len:155 (-) Transcript_4527:26-490(-)
MSASVNLFDSFIPEGVGLGDNSIERDLLGGGINLGGGAMGSGIMGSGAMGGGGMSGRAMGSGGMGSNAFGGSGMNSSSMGRNHLSNDPMSDNIMSGNPLGMPSHSMNPMGQITGHGNMGFVDLTESPQKRQKTKEEEEDLLICLPRGDNPFDFE